jgi:hypothetical protein
MEEPVSSDIAVQKRIDAGIELFQSCITGAKEVFEISFGKPTSYYDGEKKNVLEIAHRLFGACVTSEHIKGLADGSGDRLTVEVESIGNEDGDGPCSGEDGSSCTGNISGF